MLDQQRDSDLQQVRFDLESDDEGTRRQAIFAAAKLGERAIPLLPLLQQIGGQDPSVELRFLARKALNALAASVQSPAAKAPVRKSAGATKLIALEATEVIAVKLAAPDPNLRASAYRAAALKQDAKILAALVTRIKPEQEPDGELRAILVRVIAILGGKQAIKVIGAFLDDPDARVRANAVETLAQLKDVSAFALVVRALQDSDHRVQTAAITCLQALGGVNIVKLCAMMMRSSEYWARDAACYCLGATKMADAIPLLCEALNDSYEGVKIKAKKALTAFAQAGHQAAKEALAQASAVKDKEAPTDFLKLEKLNAEKPADEIKSADVKTRQRATRQIGVLSAAVDDCLPMLLERLGQEDDPTALANLIAAAGKAKDHAKTLPVIAGFVRHPADAVRAATGDALATIGTPEALAAAMPLLKDEAVSVAGRAMLAVRAHTSADISKALTELAGNTEASHRKMAAMVILELNEPRFMGLAEKLADDPVEEIAAIGREALAALPAEEQAASAAPSPATRPEANRPSSRVSGSFRPPSNASRPPTSTAATGPQPTTAQPTDPSLVGYVVGAIFLSMIGFLPFVWIGTCVWVYRDSKRRLAEQILVQGAFCVRPIAWSLGWLLMPPLTVPLYLLVRTEYGRIAKQIEAGVQPEPLDLPKIIGVFAVQLWSDAKMAASLAKMKAELATLNTVTLPDAYLQLGQEIYETRRFQEEFDAHFQAVAAIEASIADARGQQRSASGDSLADKAKSAALSVKDKAVEEKYNFDRRGKLREIGRLAYEQFGESAGSANFVGRIAELLQDAQRLNVEIDRISSSGSDRFWTPKKILALGTGFACLVALAVVAPKTDTEHHQTMSSVSNGSSGSSGADQVKPEVGKAASDSRSGVRAANPQESTPAHRASPGSAPVIPPSDARAPAFDWAIAPSSDVQAKFATCYLADELDILVLYYSLSKKDVPLDQLSHYYPALASAKNEFDKRDAFGPIKKDLESRKSAMASRPICIHGDMLPLAEYDFATSTFPLVCGTEDGKLKEGFYETIKVPDHTPDAEIAGTAISHRLRELGNQRGHTVKIQIQIANAKRYPSRVAVDATLARRMASQFEGGTLGVMNVSFASIYAIFSPTGANDEKCLMGGVWYNEKAVVGNAEFVVVATKDRTAFGVLQQAPPDAASVAEPVAPAPDSGAASADQGNSSSQKPAEQEGNAENAQTGKVPKSSSSVRSDREHRVQTIQPCGRCYGTGKCYTCNGRGRINRGRCPAGCYSGACKRCGGRGTQ